MINLSSKAAGVFNTGIHLIEHGMFFGVYQTKFYKRGINGFGELSNRFGLSVMLLLVLDALVNPYAGIVHDARLYAIQALSNLNPDVYRNDLYFLFGSQDSFSLFSLFHARFISFFGLHYGTLCLYILSRILFLGALLIFFRSFLGDNVKALFAAWMIAAGPLHYIFFDINEPFLTPRPLAMAFSMVSFAAAWKQSHKICIFLILAAGMMHPLIALGPGAIILLIWVTNREWKALIIMAIGGCLGIAMLLLKSDALLNMDLSAIIDRRWGDIVSKRSIYLFPLKWPLDEWQSIGANLLAACFSLRYLDRQAKRFVILTSAIVVSGILIAMIAAYVFPLALPFQLQTWRVFWLLRIISPAIALVWGLGLWLQKYFLKKMAALFVIISSLLAGGLSSYGFYFIIVAGVLDNLSAIRFENYLKDHFTNTILTLEMILLISSPLPMVILTFQNCFESGDCRMAMLSFTACIGPFFRPVSLFLTAFFANLRDRVAFFVLIPLFCGIVLSGVSPDVPYPRLIESQRNLIKPSPLPPAIRNWNELIPSGSVVLTDGSIPLEAMWFDLESCNYYSWEQGAGIVFNRRLAIEYQKRKNDVKLFFDEIINEDWRQWCEKNKVDFIIIKRKIFSSPLAYHEGIGLYSVK